MATTKLNAAMTENVLRTDIIDQTLTPDTVVKNMGLDKICPIGMVLLWPKTTGLPSGWLACNGTTPFISSYPDLSAILGTTYGGNGTTTFGLPNMTSLPTGLSSGTYMIRALNAAKA